MSANLAQKLMESTVDIRNAAEQGKTKDAQLLAMHSLNDNGHSAGRVEVFARVRPFSRREEGSTACIEPDDNGSTLHVRNDGDVLEKVLRGQAVEVAVTNTEVRDFSFDGVFPTDASQQHIFTTVGLPVLRECFKGINGTILAYGQTGSGKTYSLLQQGEHAEDMGLLPRLVATLFVFVAQDVAHAYQVDAAAMQIYNEQIDDLLNRDYSSGGGHNLQVQGAGDVPGLTWLKCKNPNELLEAFNRARSNVVYAETKMNKASSRSHAVFQIKISKRSHVVSTSCADSRTQRLECMHGKLSIVDLAGSERVKKSGCEGAQLKEALAINKSLFAFGNVVSALAAKRPYVPFRDSKLTRVLEGSIGGNCKTSLLVCTSPASDNVGETVNTLEFGSRAMRIEVDAKVNASMVEVNANTLVDDLKTSFDDLGFSLGPELDAVRRASCEAIESAQDEVRFRQRAVESAEKISQSLSEKVASAQIEVQSLLEKEKILTKEVESRRKLYQDMCAKNEEQCVKIEQLEAQLAAYQSAASSPNDATSNEVLSLKAQIIDMESREKVMQDELAVARRAVSDKDAERKAEIEKLAKERDDAVRVASEAKQKAAPKQRRSDEDDALIHRLRREVIQLTDQLRSVKASNADDNSQVGKAPPAQELPRTSQRVRTPTPPARLRPATPHQSSRNATNNLSRTSLVESTSLTRTPLSDLTNSIMKDVPDKDPIKDRAEIGASVAMSPNKTPVKTYGLSSPMGFRSPKVFEHIDDAADIAAGRPPRSPSPKPSPLSSQAMGSLHGSNFYLSKESTTKVFEERPRYNVYGGVSVRSALKSQPKLEASKVRNVHFTAEEPVPRSPPKWYMEHLEVLRNPTALANLRYTQNLDNARSPQGDYSPSPSPAARSGTVGNTPRQFTPPPRKLRAQGDANKTARWRS
jgi:kinesin family protein 5